MDRVAFSIGKLDVYWYGVIITVGMILAVLYALYHAKIERVKSDDIIDLALALIICGVIGARLYYVLMKLDTYIVTGGTFWENLRDTVLGMINIPGGGLAIYGGIIGGFLAGIVVARRKHIRFPIIADIAGPSVIVGQIVGRFGNFINVEAYGSATTLPWRMGIHLSYDGGESFVSSIFVHPTFLYESLWNLVGLVLITVFYKKKKFHGQMFLFYMVWYGFGRMLIEGLRTDSLYIGPLRVSQWVGGITFVVGVVLMIIGIRKTKKGETEPAEAKEVEDGSTD
ncbi:MAG: prolipoprotein diacylglyceryl transferase [Clostridia bacterium]|nr:prolipoprotein diacylglyceryl transferase [Clostridia bacterium]